MEKKIFKFDDEKQRLDIFLLKQLDGCSRSFVKNLVDKQKVFVNGKNVKAGQILKPNDEIEVVFEEPKPVEAKAQDIPLDIIYEDSDLLVINKPQGMVVHPSQTTKDGTLVNALLFSVKDLSGINGELRPGIVHRLDKDTSGVMLVAKNDNAHKDLAKQIETKTCKREYLALVCGNVKKDSGTISTHIARSKKDRKKMAVCPPAEGKVAISNFCVLKRYKDFTLMKWILDTGRTHQIRVHSKHLGHPVACDPAYGKSPQLDHEGQLLHSFRITFSHPTTKKVLEFQAPLPTYFEKILQKLDCEAEKSGTNN